MRVNKIHIERGRDWEPNKGTLAGKVEFEGDHGEIAINLDEATSIEIMRLCSEGIVRAGNALAAIMVSEVLELNAETVETPAITDGVTE